MGTTLNNKPLKILARRMFPTFVHEEYPQMIEFVRSVFTYMDQDMGQYDAVSNLLNYSDVDTTLPQFEEIFKAQYLKNFPDVLAADVDLLVKNIRSFYLNKGTEQSYRFLFGALFDSTVNFKYPKFNILRTSDGLWFTPQYLVLTDGSDNIPPQLSGGSDYNITQLIGQFITGTTTGAVAFVEDTIILADQGMTYGGNGLVKALSIVEKEGAFLPGEQVLLGDTLVENGDFSSGAAFWLTSVPEDEGVQAENNQISIKQLLGEEQPKYVYQSITVEEAAKYWLRYSMVSSDDNQVQVTVGYAPGTAELYNSGDLGTAAISNTELTLAIAAGKTMVYISLHNNMIDTDNQVIFDGISLVKENTANIPLLYIADIAAESGILDGPEQWKDTSGFLSADDESNDLEQFLQDGDEYQDFSYKIRATVDQTRYESIVKDLVHPAGFKLFSAVVPTDDLTAYALKTYYWTELIFDEGTNSVGNGGVGRPFDEIFRVGDHIVIQAPEYDAQNVLVGGSENNDGGWIVDTVNPTTLVFRSGFEVADENLTGTFVRMSTGISAVDLTGTAEALFTPIAETAILVSNLYNKRVQYFKDLKFSSSGKTIETLGGNFSNWQAGDTITIEGSRFNNGTYLLDTVTVDTITVDSAHTLVDEQLAIWIGFTKTVDNLNNGLRPTDNLEYTLDYELKMGLGNTWQSEEFSREAGTPVIISDWEELIVGDFDSKATSRFGFIDSCEIDIGP